MSTSTAELGGPPAWLDGLRTRLTPTRVGERVTDGRVYLALVVIALAIGAFSLLFPSTPTYDPWAWIIWGREIVHLDLQTTGGPSWKPLPIIFTIPFSLFGSAAPDLWLIVARAGAVLTVLLAFRLGARLTGRWGVASVTAGLAAALALVISSNFVRSMTLGDSEGLLVAFAFWGLERHLDGKYRQAFVLGFLAALLRPEVWPFIAVYGAWLWLIDRRALWLVLTLWILIPILWFLPELWGSGNLMRAADRAQEPSPNSPAFAKHPFVKVIQNTWPLVITPLKIACAFAVIVAAWEWFTRRRQGVILAIFLLAIAWIVLIAGMTQAGFSGNPRYIILGTSLLAVVGGVGFGRIVQFASTALRRLGGAKLATAGGLVMLVLLALATSHWARPRFDSFDNLARALRYQAELRFDLEKTLAKAGGADAFKACGPVTAGKYSVPMVAWYLDEHTLNVGLVPAPTGAGSLVAARTTNNPRLVPQPPAPYPPGYKPISTYRSTALFSTCPSTTAG